MKKLATEMKILVEFATAMIEANRNEPDPHLKTCHQVADQFDLWEPAQVREKGKPAGEVFPTWLSYVVAGIGRDLGILI